MAPISRSAVVRYGLAIVGVVLACFLTQWFGSLRELPAILFFAAVFGSARFGGLGPGLLATALSVGALDYLFLAPARISGSARPIHLLSSLVFALVALLTSYIIETRKRAEQAVRAAYEAERQAHEAAEAEIRKRRELEEQLKNRATELLRADRSKDDFLATLAHELRNPLAPICNALHLLKVAGNNGSDSQWARDMIERQVRQMVRLVDDLLDISRIARGKLQVRKGPVQLGPLIASAVEISRPLLEQRRHQLTVTLPTEPVWLEADESRLIQVVVNLLNNAAKYTEDGGRITLTGQCEGSGLVLRIRDTGVGISPEMLPRIFERFVQVERSLNRSHGGLGIGLTLVRTLVEIHGGKVEAHSEGPGQGSEFIVRLPLGSPPPPRLENGIAPRSAAPVRTMRVLAVIRDRQTAEELGRLLQSAGHNLRTVSTTDRAFDLMPNLQPDLVLCELGVPDIDGRELAQRIRQLSGFERIVLAALNRSDREADRRAATEAGFDYQLHLPVAPEELKTVLAARGTPLVSPA